MKLALSLTALALSLSSLTPAFAGSPNFAASVVSSSHLSPNPSFGDPSAALGQPTMLDDDTFGDLYHASMVQPAFGVDQSSGKNLLAGFDSSGTGELTVQMAAPIVHSGASWYGQDFIVFSNQGFIGNGFAQEGTDMSTYQIADGSTFGTLPTVSVSADGLTFYTVTASSSIAFPENPYHWDGLAAAPETAGWGALNDFTKPVDPTLTANDFAGKTVAQADNILYDGSAGGTSFDFADQTPLTTIRYIRFSANPFGPAGIVDGVVAVGSPDAAPVPEAGTLQILLLGLAVLAVPFLRRRRAAQ